METPELTELKIGDEVRVPDIPGTGTRLKRSGFITLLSDDGRFARVRVHYGRMNRTFAFKVSDLCLMGYDPEIAIGRPESPHYTREMTDREKQAARRLARCSFLPASFDKRFARSMAVQKKASSAQINFLWRLIYQYRRQIGDEYLVEEAKQIIGIV